MSKSTLSDRADWTNNPESAIALQSAIGILETLGWAAAIVALDHMAKAANIVVIQAEWTDMLGSVIRRKGEISVCGTCMDARGMTDERLIEGARRGTMDIVTEWTQWADKVLVF